MLTGEPCDVLLLNPDAVLTGYQLEHLAASLHRAENARVGAASPRLVGDDGEEQRVLWPFPSPTRSLLDAVGLGRVHGRSHDFAIGAVLLLRWEALHAVGLFDERFFLYAEEADWQRRALAIGWTSLLVDDIVARHTGAGTSEDPRHREKLFHAAQETYIRKWHGSAGWLVYRAGAVAGAAVRSIVLTGERRSAAARRAVLYARGPLRSAPTAKD
ncbi:MAG: glycosyltransferase family 2 protein [Actinobacteria bacterium]|nr:glycosyltransferase family 2 protein [Actinomycetota bacterium]